MGKMGKKWFLNQIIDFEYEKYNTLDYLKGIRKHFQKLELYPYLDNLIDDRDKLINCQNDLKQIRLNVPSDAIVGELESLDFVKNLIRGGDNISIDELEKILDFTISEVEKVIKEGKAIFEFVESQLIIEKIGDESWYDLEGFLFFEENEVVEIFQYELSSFGKFTKRTGYKTMRTKLVGKENARIGYNKIKMGLEKSFEDLSNPLTYLIKSTIDFPKKQTVFPVAKRILARRLSLY